MPQDANRLIWIDLEMTGLKPDTDRIIEVALVVTDHALNTVAQAPVWVVHQDDAVLDAMDSWNQATHGALGPDRQGEGVDARPKPEVEAAALAFLREHVPAKVSPMCGNSICQDRRFLARCMPRARGLVPLPQPRRVDAEGARAPLEARADEGHSEGRQARGACRHPESIDELALLPRALPEAVIRVHLLTSVT